MKNIAIYAEQCSRDRKWRLLWSDAARLCQPRLNPIQQLKAILSLIDVIECAAPMQDDGDPHYVPVMP